uniref:p19 kDa protein n=1 Tax=Grapevine leafroll-associated virus 2 TaxID=64003 RepID=A0A067Y7Q5_9CLOS|nr:p19 kDa protein [Grapevine leafroll-associated virus 2]
MEEHEKKSESLVLLRTNLNTMLLVIESDASVELPKLLICGYLRVSGRGEVTCCNREELVKEFEGNHHAVIRSKVVQYDSESAFKEFNDSDCVVKFFLETGSVFWFSSEVKLKEERRDMRTFFEANNFFFGSHCGTMEYCLKQVLTETESIIDSFCEERNR